VVVPVVLKLLKTLIITHSLVYGMGAGGETVSTKTAENIDHSPYSGYGVGWQVMVMVVLQLLKTLTTDNALVYGMEAGGGTGSTTTAENIHLCPYSGIKSGVAGDGNGSTTTAGNIHLSQYSGVKSGDCR